MALAVEPKGKLTLLPSAKTPAKTRLEDYNILIHGRPKVGKTAVAAQFDSPIFLATEAGTNTIEVYQVPIPDWPTFLAVCAEIVQGNHKYKTVVIDTISNLFRACEEYVCTRAKITHPSDLEWGKGYAMVRDEFQRALTKLSLLPYGLVCIAHSDDVEIKTRTGNITRTVPKLPSAARDTIVPMADFILYFASELTKEGDKRTIRTRPSENWEAGNRFEVDEFPAELPMGNKPVEAYAEFKRAFETAIKIKAQKEVASRG